MAESSKTDTNISLDPAKVAEAVKKFAAKHQGKTLVDLANEADDQADQEAQAFLKDHPDETVP